MFRFGSVAVDVPGRELSVGGEQEHLEPQAFDLLTYLIEHRDRVVPKTELLDEVWGDQFVSESALTTRIKEVRRAVGDDGRTQGVINNVRGRGYRFVAPIDVASGDVTEPADVQAADPGLIGRSVEFGQIERALGTARIVSLIGPGGVGKTTLATAVARSIGDSIVVDLSSIDDESGVLGTWRQAAGLVGPIADESTSIDAFAASSTTAVLDNCEHVIGRVAELLDAFARAGGDGRVLATSRERLGVPGEVVLPIQPLRADAARAVFIDRATRTRPDFRLADDDIDDLDALLESIDRLPLAIEMAAGRVGSLTIGDLRAAIDSSATLLRSTHRHPTSRHRSITDVVAWSEGLLEPAEREVFFGFGVFAGPVGLDDAVGVLGDGDRAEVLDAIASLVDRSLIVADLSSDAARYRMLETTKAYVRERSASPRSAQHAHWFAARAGEVCDLLHTSQEGAASRRFGELLPELRVAHTWAREHDRATAVRITASLARWSHDRLRGEPVRWAERLLPELPPGSTEWCDVAAAIAGDAAHRAEYDVSEDLATRALEAASPLARLSALDALGNVALYRGELDGLTEFSEQLGDEAAVLGLTGGVVVQATVGRALALIYAGEAETGRAVIDSYRPLPDAPSDQGWLAYGSAESFATADAGAAIPEYRRAIALADEAGAELLLSVSRIGLAAALGRAGEANDAIEGFRTILDAFQRTANLTHAITALRNATTFLVRIGEDQIAMELFGALSGDLSGASGAAQIVADGWWVSDEIKSTFGIEQADLVACKQTVEGRAGRDAVEEWIATGRTWRPQVALQAAIDALA